MKQFLWTLSLLAGLCAFASAQEPAKPNCPTLEVTGPAGITAPGGVMPFVLTVSDPSLRKLTFAWTVSAGTIVEGQGSRVIKVIAPTDRTGPTVNATVTVNGLPNSCANSASNISAVSAPISWEPLDMYSALSLNDEKARLMNGAVLLRKNPGMKLVIMRYVPWMSPADKQRISILTDFLLKNGDLKKDQFVFVIRFKPTVETVIFLLPPGMKLPD
jgi:hypothetical protein